jgi:hypothetical protein
LILAKYSSMYSTVNAPAKNHARQQDRHPSPYRRPARPCLGEFRLLGLCWLAKMTLDKGSGVGLPTTFSCVTSGADKLNQQSKKI